jgi:hypothetical protein
MVIRRKHLAGVALGSLLVGGVLMGLVAGIGTPGIRDPKIADAAQNQDMGLVRTLLVQGVDANSTQPDGATALHWAVHWNDIATAEVLIGEGANVNAVNRAGASPLSLACTNGNTTMVQALLDARANANTASPSGETPLMRCARSGLAEAVKILLAHGAQVNGQLGAIGHATAARRARAACHEQQRQCPESSFVHGARLRRTRRFDR